MTPGIRACSGWPEEALNFYDGLEADNSKSRGRDRWQRLRPDVRRGPRAGAAAVTAPALTVMAIISFMGKISGAHLNPAVSIAFALRRDFP